MGRVPTKQLKVPTKAAPEGMRGNFRNGVFSLMVDYSLPSKEKPLLMAMEEGTKIVKLLAKDKRVACMCITDRVDAKPYYQLLEVCQTLRKASRKLEMLVGVAGSGRCENDLAKILTDLAALRIDSILTYVGSRLPDHVVADSGKPVSAPQDYLDSAKMIYLARRQWPDALVGTRINPFKYCIEDAHLQYYRMIKGLASGAEFLFAQPGWDMKKFHEAQWYMRMRELEAPIIAQVRLLQYEDVNDILNHDWPGIALSREIGAVVQRQFADERHGVEAALIRLGLQVAGCRLLGYSGVCISGCEDALSVELALKYATEALETYDDYDTWLDAWEDAVHGVESAPSGSRYYVFENLLQRGELDFDDDLAELSDHVLPDPDAPERLRYSLAKRFAGNERGPIVDTIRRFLCGYRPGAEWRLDKTAMLCAAECPKGLEEGVCEESQPDGTCEFGHRPCFFHDVLKLEQWHKRLESFEAPYED